MRIIVLLCIYIPLQNPYLNLAVKKLWRKKKMKMKNMTGQFSISKYPARTSYDILTETSNQRSATCT